MSEQSTLNPVLFESADILMIVEGVNGRPVAAAAIDEALTAAGITPEQQEAIETTYWRLLYKTASAAFQAGYLVGRDPDRLVMANIGSPYTQ